MIYNDSEVLNLNIRGQIFEVPVAVLNNSSNKSLLNVIYDGQHGSESEKNRKVHLDSTPRMLEKILDYHISGQLHLPHYMCADEIKRELEFWMIDERHLAECCWCTYQEIQESHKMADEVSMMFGCPQVTPLPSGNNEQQVLEPFNLRMWRRLEDPGSCKLAMAISAFSSAVAVVTVLLFCMETVIPLRIPRSPTDNFTKHISNEKIKSYIETKPRPELVYACFVCVSFIAIEMIVRFIFCPRKLRFYLDFLNVVDLCVVINGFVMGYYEVTGLHFATREGMHVYLRLKAVSTVVVLRLLRPLRKVTLIRVLWLSLKSTKSAHIFLLVILGFCTVIFAAVIYVAEAGNPNSFWSIPEGIWWSVITMTTVGYGDVYPETVGGYFTGIACAVTGIIILALPIPILTNAFTAYHDSYLQLKRLRKRENKVDDRSQNL